MRINRLDLTRYGKFTDGVLDFGYRSIGSPDLHIIYGPNEAGKSTTFDAIVDLVFGIGTSSRYGFLHPYPTMRIGAGINVGGRNREFVRIKRPQNSLLDDQERVLPEVDIKADLGGIDRDAFATMFSLDDESLEKGGEGILASKGNLGELLFAASAGLADLSRQLTVIRGDADTFYRYRARSGTLAELKGRISDLKQQREALDLQASEFSRLVIERDRLAGLYEEAIAARAGTQRRIEEVRCVLNALPVMSRRGSLRDRLTDLGLVPQPPETWRQELQELKRSEIELRVKLEDVSATVASLEREIEEISIDPAALAIASQVEELSELRARYVTAEKDIPKLTARASELSIESILIQLGRPGQTTPADLLLDAVTTGSLRSLMESKSGVDAKYSSAQDELLRAERALTNQEGVEVDHALTSAERVSAFEKLQAIITAVPKSDQDVILRSLARREEMARRTLAEALTALRPWQGQVEALSSLVPPTSARIESWKKSFTALEDQQRISRAELQRLELETRRLEAEITTLRTQAGRIDEEMATVIREERDHAWTLHRQTLDNSSADAFEIAMRRDDHLIAQRLMHFADMGRLNQLGQRLAVVVADSQSQEKILAEARSEMEALRSEIRRGLAQSGSDPAITENPWEMEEWSRRREAALKSRDELAAIEREIHDVRDHVDRSRRLIVQALADAKIPVAMDTDIGSLISFAETALNAFHASANSAAQIDRLRNDISERKHILEAADEASKTWLSQWSALCAACWLRDLGHIPSVGAVTEILTLLERLASAVDARESLVDRIQKMAKDKHVFEMRIHELSVSLGLSAEGAPLSLCQAIFERIKTVGHNADRHRNLREHLDGVRQDEHALRVGQGLLMVRMSEMMDFFSVGTFEAVETSIDLAYRRRDLENSIAQSESELFEMTGASSMVEIEAMTASADRSALADELAKLIPLLDDQDARCRDVFHCRSKAQDSLDAIGGDARVASIEEQRRTALIEVEESARRYMEIRAGVAAAEHALAIYRDRHRSGMMARASDAFRTISRGAYQGVAAQPGKDGDVLIAVSASGGSKAANELSKGARFQLYLALRVAGYHEFVANRTSVPFIADDIMETFDDFRAEEAFRLFTDMGTHGQVIYLTHHRHLTDIARKVCPNVRVHNLEDLGRPPGFQVVAAE
ncbi:AAA family ATPase [Rhizobium grahamii]|uniref:YhaN AAA domain-containing protein n=1 Tax=Rhizobium grahamii TaxID=1120045 RepID=A0A370KF76_9HYPH|nr:AAA family ATPase [Rhizobium grahamii]RDJ02981.1 hypothetical protein B5K06_31315 [Rhizobium grahamii]